MPSSPPHLTQDNLPISSLVKHSIAVLLISALITEDILDERIEYGWGCLQYCSIYLDVWIVFRTVVVVFKVIMPINLANAALMGIATF